VSLYLSWLELGSIHTHTDFTHDAKDTGAYPGRSQDPEAHSNILRVDLALQREDYKRLTQGDRRSSLDGVKEIRDAYAADDWRQMHKHKK
jgi:hypothetical protein